MLTYRVHCAIKVFDARTLHNKSFNAAILAERIIKATRCDWLLAVQQTLSSRAHYTTNGFERVYIGNKRLTDSIFESARRLLSWSGQQKTNVLASLRPAYNRQLLGVNRQITDFWA